MWGLSSLNGPSHENQRSFAARAFERRYTCMSGPPNRPPPGAGSQSFEPTPPKPPTPAQPVGLRWLPFIFGAGAVFWLVQLAQFAAIVAAPNGRDQLHQA